jgi:Lysozyme like domain
MATPEEEAGRSMTRRWKRDGSSLSAARAGLKVEVAELKKVSSEFEVIRKGIRATRIEMDNLAKSAAIAMGNVKGATGSGGGKAQNGMPQFSNSSPSIPSKIAAATSGVTRAGAGPGGVGSAMGGMRGMFANFGGTGMAALVLGQIGGQMVGALDSRIDRGAQYATSADRLNVLFQQRTGMSQMGVMNQMRKPLTNYRIGSGGINDMLQFQYQTGVQASGGMANSIAGMRALTGYSKTTADVLQDQRAAMDPHVANRMFNMLGVNAYGVGGKVNDPVKMMQQVVKQMGLANPNVLKSASLPGSITRARMQDAGVSEELQDQYLQYANSQVAFAKKGGKGMYDPSKKSDRKLMGIEENFATQQEETARLRTARDETFTRRNVDNMAAMERNTQTMVKILGSIEDKLSGLIGARTGARGWMKLGGRLLQTVGAGLAVTGIGTAAGVGMMAAGSVLSGDPVHATGDGSGASGGAGSSDSSRDSSIMVPVGYNGKRAALSEVKGMATFRDMQPKMQDRLLKMMRANPNIGIGQGKRDSKQQEQMFRQRYRKTDQQVGKDGKKNIFWEGSYWEHVAGAAAAPPGRSMHEIGLAADLVGDLGWMNAHASQFGLKHFAGVNNEPWHVQPSDEPNSRSEYEKGGIPAEKSGTNGPVPTTTGAARHQDQYSPSAGPSNGFKGYTHFVFGGGNRTVGGGAKGGAAGTPTNVPGAGTLTGDQIAKVAYRAGFRGDALVNFVGIALRESGGRTAAYNGKGVDNSIGLWQINMKGSLEADRIKRYGLKSREDLYDPSINARVAYEMSQGGKNMGPWNIKGNPLAKVDKASAAKYVQAAGYPTTGDPMPTSGGGSTHISHAPTYQISVAPNINFVGMPSSPDLKKLAQEVGSLLREEVRTLEMRNS